MPINDPKSCLWLIPIIRRSNPMCFKPDCSCYDKKVWVSFGQINFASYRCESGHLKFKFFRG